MRRCYHLTSRALPVFAATSRLPDSSSDLFPTNITGIPLKSPLTCNRCLFNYFHRCNTDTKISPLLFCNNFFGNTSLTNSSMDLSSSKLCLDAMENTRMNAWPLEMDKRCIAGNWCDPVVSVICNVHISFLFDDITYNLRYLL